MNDLALFFIITMTTYLCSVGFTIILVRLFFPLMTREEVERIKSMQTLTNHQIVPGKPSVLLPLLNKSGQLV